MSAPARFDAYAELAAPREVVNGIDNMLFKFNDFRTVAYDGSDGWHYTNCSLTLSRVVDDNPIILVNYLLHFDTASVGRRAWGYWPIHLLLLSKGAPVRQFLLGSHDVGRNLVTHNFQGNLANVIEASPYPTTMMPMTAAEIASIDQAYLFASGQQETL